MNFSFLPQFWSYFNYGVLVTIMISVCVVFFGTILESGISSINELSSKNGIDHVRQLVSQAQTLEPEQVEILKNLTQLLLDARFQAWKNHF